MSDMILQIYTRHERADVTRKYVFLDVDDGEKAHEEREWLLTEVERQRAEIERLRAEMIHLAEWCEMEVPLTHDYMSYRLRKALEIKP